MRRFHHGHAAGLGFLLCLALERHTLVLVLGALLAGVVIGRTWATIATIADRLVRRIPPRPTARRKATLGRP